MGNTLQSKSPTISIWYELNYDKNYLLIDDPQWVNIPIVINDYQKEKTTYDMRP